jgi:hypothetical protein
MNIDIPFAPQDISTSQTQINFHIRLPVREVNAPIFDLAAAKFDSNTHSKFSPKTPECPDFPFLTTREIQEKTFDRLKNVFLEKLSLIPSPVWYVTFPLPSLPPSFIISIFGIVFLQWRLEVAQRQQCDLLNYPSRAREYDR